MYSKYTSEQQLHSSSSLKYLPPSFSFLRHRASHLPWPFSWSCPAPSLSSHVPRPLNQSAASCPCQWSIQWSLHKRLHCRSLDFGWLWAVRVLATSDLVMARTAKDSYSNRLVCQMRLNFWRFMARPTVCHVSCISLSSFLVQSHTPPSFPNKLTT